MSQPQAIHQLVGFLHLWNPQSLDRTAAEHPDLARAGFYRPGVDFGPSEGAASGPSVDAEIDALFSLVPPLQEEADRVMAFISARLARSSRAMLWCEILAVVGSGGALGAAPLSRFRWAVYLGASVALLSSILNIVARFNQNANGIDYLESYQSIGRATFSIRLHIGELHALAQSPAVGDRQQRDAKFAEIRSLLGELNDALLRIPNYHRRGHS